MSYKEIFKLAKQYELKLTRLAGAECPECKGSGQSGAFVCPKCNGLGVDPSLPDCPQCLGKGRLGEGFGSSSCEGCGGTGKIQASLTAKIQIPAIFKGALGQDDLPTEDARDVLLAKLKEKANELGYVDINSQLAGLSGFGKDALLAAFKSLVVQEKIRMMGEAVQVMPETSSPDTFDITPEELRPPVAPSQESFTFQSLAKRYAEFLKKAKYEIEFGQAQIESPKGYIANKMKELLKSYPDVAHIDTEVSGENYVVIIKFAPTVPAIQRRQAMENFQNLLNTEITRLWPGTQVTVAQQNLTVA